MAFNRLMGPVFHWEHCHSHPHHLCLNLCLYFLGLLQVLSLCDLSGCAWHQRSCHILHLSGRSCAFEVVPGLGNLLVLSNISQLVRLCCLTQMSSQNLCILNCASLRKVITIKNLKFGSESHARSQHKSIVHINSNNIGLVK